MKKLIFLLLSVAFLGTGCKKDYLDINQNPNAPTDASITPDLLLPRTLHVTASRMAINYDFLAGWMGYWARSGTYGPTTEQESYNITNSFQATQWSGWYAILFDYNTIEKKANASNQKEYEAIAKVMKTVGFMYLVDMYNNVPYSQAFNLSAFIQPAYDKGEDIYADLFVQLDNALALLDEENGQSYKISTADIMFHGDKTKWKKFINTQRLKLALRESQVAGFDYAAQMAKITPEGFIGSGETASVNPGYVQDDGKQNPFWDSYNKNYLGDRIDDYNRANNYVLNIFKNTNDVRYKYYFQPAEAPLNGVLYFGYDYGFVDPNPNNPKAANSSGVAGPGLAKSPTQDQWLFTSVESLFLQAEAIQRGWLPGDPQAAYNAAVRESFIFLGVTDAIATADAYLASANQIANWGSATDKIKLIITQKYLALVGINNFEAWVDYRRTGFPNVPLSLSPSVGTNVIPIRLRYPQAEYDYNAPNVNAENNPSPFTSPVFWDR